MVCCCVHCDVHGRENDVPFDFTLICFIEVSFLFWYLCLIPHACVQDDFHIRSCLRLLAETQRWSRNCWSFLSIWVHPRFLVGSLVFCVVFCRSLFIFPFLNPTKSRGEFGCTRRASSYCSTNGTRTLSKSDW